MSDRFNEPPNRAFVCLRGRGSCSRSNWPQRPLQSRLSPATPMSHSPRERRSAKLAPLHWPCYPSLPLTDAAVPVLITAFLVSLWLKLALLLAPGCWPPPLAPPLSPRVPQVEANGSRNGPRPHLSGFPHDATSACLLQLIRRRNFCCSPSHTGDLAARRPPSGRIASARGPCREPYLASPAGPYPIINGRVLSGVARQTSDLVLLCYLVSPNR